jgi:hypothetical protein
MVVPECYTQSTPNLRKVLKIVKHNEYDYLYAKGKRQRTPRQKAVPMKKFPREVMKVGSFLFPVKELSSLFPTYNPHSAGCW